jgi:rubrerythrin
MNRIEVEKLFSIAIKRELEANSFYSDVAQRVTGTEVKKVFQQLAEEEMGHFELLERFRNDPSLTMKIPAPAEDFKIAESEELPSLSVDMKPADAIKLAMKKEQQAVEFYRGIGSKTDDSELKTMFANLANMELGHKHRLENVFIDIGYPEVF